MLRGCTTPWYAAQDGNLPLRGTIGNQMPTKSNYLAQLQRYCSGGRGRQKQVAEAIGVSRQRINDWIAGRVQPTGDQILSLLAFLAKPEMKIIFDLSAFH